MRALDDHRLTIGRDPSAGLTLDDTEVSRFHAEVCLEGGHWIIVDLRSTNGTRVNARSVTSARLKHGDRISLGDHTIQFLIEADRSPERVFRMS